MANSPARFSRSPLGVPYLTQKCDEQREEGDSCRTCRRLQLDCLGWGPRRPDWMRVRHRPSSPFALPPSAMLTHPGANARQDKEAVQAYKMNIKSHLLRLGLIRGQPRTSLTTGTSAQASGLVGTRSTGPNSSRAGSERRSFQLPFDDPQQQLAEFSFPSGMPSSMSGKKMIHLSVFHVEHRIHTTTPGNAPFPSPSAASPSFSDTWIPSDLYGLSHILRPSASPGLSVESASFPPDNFSNVPGVGGHLQWGAMQPTGLTDQDAAVKRDHLAYYFNNVRGLQYLFTCKVALDAIQAVSGCTAFNLYVSGPNAET